MFTNFFLELRQAKVPVSIKEYLALMEAMEKGVSDYKVDDFYYLSRSVLVKDERNLDKFDRVFGHVFKGLEALPAEGVAAEIPEEWLRKLAEKLLTDEEKAQIEAMGGWEKLMETLKKRLEEQQKRHQGGSKWIGTAGTSPFGAYGFNPEGVRIGQDKNREGRAVKVWDKREYKNLDDTVEIGTRNIKLALRRLRKFAREGAEVELDMPDTIRSTARNAGYLDIKMIPERRNKVKLLAAVRHRRLDGRPHPRLRGAVLGGALGVQAPRILLLPQLPLREAVEGQSPPPRRHLPDAAAAPHLPARLQDHLRRRRLDEPLRDRLSRRLGRALERGGGPGLDPAHGRHLSQHGVAEPGARAALELHTLHPIAAAAQARIACFR